MDNGLWITLLLASVGTFLMRLLPLLWLWTKSLGWPVLAGVFVYGAVILLTT